MHTTRALQNRILLISLACFTYKAVSNDINKLPEPSKWQAQIQLDNDLFAGSDRDYTNGVRLGFVQEVPGKSEKGQHWERRLRNSSRKLTGQLQSLGFKEDSDLRFARGFGLSQLIFTPENPLALTAPDGERPYASWLGLEYSFHVKEDSHVNSLTMSVGTTGDPSLGQSSQNWVHRNISNSPIFQGWESQIPTELTVNLHYDHKQRFRKFSKLTNSGLEVDGYYEGGLALGNFRTDSYIGGLARIGYRLPRSFSTPRVQLGSYGHQLFNHLNAARKRPSIFAFGGIRATSVFHDITLDGPVFRDFDTGVQSKSLVGELLLGIGIRYQNIDLIFSRALRTDEFNGQAEQLQFGSVMLRFQPSQR